MIRGSARASRERLLIITRRDGAANVAPLPGARDHRVRATCLEIGQHVGPMDLIEIDVIGAESLEARVQRLDDCELERPTWFRAGSGTPATLVASTISRRRFPSALPRIVSDSPAE